jgi:hypothetical protein
LAYIWIKQQLDHASIQEESMIRQVCLATLGAIALLLTFFSNQSVAYDYETDTLFYDDFSAGTTENWELVLGEWVIDDAKMCQLACSS